jgi:N-acetylated-alpha-linked acidic dipeptidase
MRDAARILALFCLYTTPGLAQPAPKPDEAAAERQFDAAIHPDDLRDWMRTMASQPNQVGSPHDKANAEFELEKFKSWGWSAHIETFRVLYPTPISESLTLEGDKPFKASLTEPPVAGDEATQQVSTELPAYVAYQGDGDVTAPLVYVNYGMPEDYRLLAQYGVSVAGKIVIARYGEGWRGLKPRLAQEHGASGCIIYSDPSGDGYAVDKTYPDGPMRPPHGVQRGSVADMTLFPGDPLTAGLPQGAPPRRRQDAPTIMRIPVLPISYADAQVFLSGIGGQVAPRGWRGSLPITYHVGPSEMAAHLVVKSDWSEKTIYDVIATMPGADLADQWVLRGNHHDGWVFGASDPLSGQVALMAEAQAFGALAKQGWRPRRTLVYASWDAEEPMLVGSTAWAEAHADELKRKAVVYVNSDTNGRGILSAGGSQDFQHLVNSVANAVKDPETGASVGDRTRAKIRLDATLPDADAEDQAAAKLVTGPGHEFPLAPLGSGSDFSSFLQHLGLPAIDLEFGGEGQTGGVYHSAYDSFAHHSRFVDPGFVYDALLARTAGRVVMRTAESELPMQRAGDFAEAVAFYLSDIKKLADSRREAAEQRAKLLNDRVYQLAADPIEQRVPPEALSPVPFFEFAKLENAVERLKHNAHAYDAALAKFGAGLPPDRVTKLQAIMLTIDQSLAPDVGLPGRPWYKNLVYAPGHLTGYGAKTLPGVREAVEDRRWADADRYAALTAAALDAYSDRLVQATGVLDGT